MKYLRSRKFRWRMQVVLWLLDKLAGDMDEKTKAELKAELQEMRDQLFLVESKIQ